MMAKSVLCLSCGGQKVPRHCTSTTCPWVECPAHGRMRLSADQRKALG